MNLSNSDGTESLTSSKVSPSHLGVNFNVVLGVDEVALSRQLSPAFLAYLGDGVYELYVRTHYLLPPRRLTDYHNQVVAQVRAETQAASLRNLTPHLTEAEREIVRRGRNAATGIPRRLSREVYQQATSLETLIGYLYLYNPERLQQLLEKLSVDFT